MTDLTVVSLVHYRTLGRCYAAMVINVGEGRRCDLQRFGLHFGGGVIESIVEDPTGEKDGTWHLPEKQLSSGPWHLPEKLSSE